MALSLDLLNERVVCDVAASFEEAVVDTLNKKIERALKQTGCHSLVVAGGVGANYLLRSRLRAWAESNGCALFFPPHDFCTDNAAMVAYTASLMIENDRSVSRDYSVLVRSRWPLNQCCL